MTPMNQICKCDAPAFELVAKSTTHRRYMCSICGAFKDMKSGFSTPGMPYPAKDENFQPYPSSSSDSSENEASISACSAQRSAAVSSS